MAKQTGYLFDERFMWHNAGERFAPRGLHSGGVHTVLPRTWSLLQLRLLTMAKAVGARVHLDFWTSALVMGPRARARTHMS